MPFDPFGSPLAETGTSDRRVDPDPPLRVSNVLTWLETADLDQKTRRDYANSVMRLPGLLDELTEDFPVDVEEIRARFPLSLIHI